ncbi:hypothetical protein ANN_06360 [Periplaneta americana]|uniref:Leucine-rich repeat-containing protein 45 n=1 Tax=Periplaneta americana TaxID=6978 RepID=A0ABQ8TDI3_PERAM|nr:hypothetical protein ANN_06360 [Periplaneta americana]
MSNEVQEYSKFCQKNNIQPNEDVVAALKLAGYFFSETGELDLSRKTLSSWTWETLARIISSSMNIKTLKLSDCLIPPRGMTSLLASLSHDCSIESLDLRGNAMQANNVANLGALLRQNCVLKRLSLEWNSTGVFIDAFSQLCEGLATNSTLEVLDMKNNQLPPEAGQCLSSALKRNTCLRTLEQCAEHNSSKERLRKDCEMKTDFLKRHLRRLEEERTSEVQELSRSNEVRIREVIRDSESRVNQLESVLSERASTINMLQDRLTTMDKTLREQQEKKENLQNIIDDKDKMYEQLVEEGNKQKQEFQKYDYLVLTVTNNVRLGQKLAEKEEEIRSMIMEYEFKLAAEINSRKQVETEVSTQLEEMKRLAAENLQLNETLKTVRKKHQDSLEEERKINQELLVQIEKKCEEKLSQHEVELTLVRAKYQNQVRTLEQSKEEMERNMADLRSQLSRERIQWQDDLASAQQQAKSREIARMAQYEEKINSLREEKTSLEKQLALSHSTMTQLQQQNSSLVAELGEPQRKLSQLHEAGIIIIQYLQELSTERVAAQRLRAELSESASRLEAKKQESEKLQRQLEDLQKTVTELTAVQTSREKEHTREVDKLQTLLAQREREIQNVRYYASCEDRADEVERAGVLYSAFSKYLGGLSPSAGVSQTSLRA